MIFRALEEGKRSHYEPSVTADDRDQLNIDEHDFVPHFQRVSISGEDTSGVSVFNFFNHYQNTITSKKFDWFCIMGWSVQIEFYNWFSVQYNVWIWAFKAFSGSREAIIWINLIDSPFMLLNFKLRANGWFTIAVLIRWI